MAGQGSVAWLFEKKGFITIQKDKTTEEQLMDVAVGAGAEDMKLICIAMPPWPGDSEATLVEGIWEPTI